MQYSMTLRIKVELTAESKYHNDLDKSILKVIIYFDLFRHPVTTQEIVDFNQIMVNQEEVELTATRLVDLKIINRCQDFLGLDDLENKVLERIHKSKLAKKSIRRIKKYSKIVAMFPFVRAVFLTGSYSKGVMGEDSDLDFFIVTDKGKLWITKSLMVAFRKLILFDSHKNFCINYMVTSDALIINDRNQFTATELITMIPVYGVDLYNQMLESNQWIYRFFPNYPVNVDDTIILNLGITAQLKYLAEKLLDFSFVKSLGEKFMRLSAKNYRKKYSDGLSEEDFRKAIVVSPDVSKVHPHFFQKKVLDEFEMKVNTICDKYAIKTLC